jgi:hypothetical protein
MAVERFEIDKDALRARLTQFQTRSSGMNAYLNPSIAVKFLRSLYACVPPFDFRILYSAA